MPLECAMLCLDTSNYMRNGDLHPTRLSAQQQSVSSLARFKLDDNLESCVGLLTMAGHKVDVHLSPSRELHKLLNCIKAFKPSGQIDILTSLKVSQLTLRNRSNKNQRQRIIMYIASPIINSNEQLIAAGKELRKNNVALDVILFGHESFENDNVAKAQLLIDTVQSANNSNLVFYCEPGQIETIPEAQRPSLDSISNFSLGEVVIRSPLGRNVKPRVVVAPAGPAAVVNPMQVVDDVVVDDEELDADLLAAMELSRAEYESQNKPTTTTPAKPAQPPVSDAMNDIDEDEMDADLLAAIQLSLAADNAAADGGDDDFAAMLEAVSGGAVTEETKDGKKDEEKKD